MSEEGDARKKSCALVEMMMMKRLKSAPNAVLESYEGEHYIPCCSICRGTDPGPGSRMPRKVLYNH